MASPEVFDVDSLLQPIRPDQPAGDDLRGDASPTSPYYQIKDARNQARAAERHAMMTGDDDAPPDWDPILMAAPSALQQHSKDLEVGAYFVEALARESGFPGLRDGFRLLRGLVENFGEQLYPLPDEDGAETTVAPLTGLNGDGADGTLIAPIAQIALTDETNEGSFSQADYVQAQEIERMPPDAQQRRLSQGGVSMSNFQAAVHESSPEFCANLYEDIQQTIEEFSGLTSVLDEKFGRMSPPSSAIRKSLEASKDVLEAVAKDKLAVAAAEEEHAEQQEEEAGDDSAAESPSKPKEFVGKIENREDAFREILKISAYFRRTEPHSPISYALEQIVRWGRLPLPDLLKEVIDDESSVSKMFRLVGIRPPNDTDG